jgi:hypothetical protein
MSRVAESLGGAARRVGRAWRVMAADQRLVAMAALGLFGSMFLPWYVETIVTTPFGQVHHENVIAFGGKFSFVEAAVLLVAAGVLVLLFARAERRPFHLPGGDGLVIMGAGIWCALLIFYRLLDTPHTSHNGAQVITDVGLKWGIFIALAAAIGLAFAGSRVRAAQHPEPPLQGERPTEAHVPGTERTRPMSRQLTLDDEAPEDSPPPRSR